MCLNLYDNIISEIKSFFDEEGYGYKYQEPPEEMLSNNIDNNNSLRYKAGCFLEAFFEYKHRRISKIKREVLYSDEISMKLKEDNFKEYLDVVKGIENDFKMENDIDPRLSKRIKDSSSNDAMLYEWNLYHLHLGNLIKSDGFIERTGPLLIVCLVKEKAYFIDITANHSNNEVFANKEYLDIINKNWPYLLNAFSIEEAKNVGYEPDRKERVALRKNNINSFAVIDGKIIMPPGFGLTAAGTSTAARIASMRFMTEIKKAYDEMCKDGKLKVKLILDREKLEFCFTIVKE